MENKISFEGFSDFEFNIEYSELERKNHFKQIDNHVHSECEIYINLTGDISFMVDNEVYEVERGNAIIVKPDEYHHCIYRSDKLHKHFWILISVNGNENILELFMKKNTSDSLIITKDEEKEELIEICNKLLDKELDKYERYILFFKLLKLLRDGQKNKNSLYKNNLPEDVIFAMDYINRNLSGNILIKDIATDAFVSVNTLERHFKENLNLSPTEYIKDRRLIEAARLLRLKKSVLEAAMESGFCDSSYFIVCFKEKFKMTPFAYKKKNCEKINE